MKHFRKPVIATFIAASVAASSLVNASIDTENDGYLLIYGGRIATMASEGEVLGEDWALLAHGDTIKSIGKRSDLELELKSVESSNVQYLNLGGKTLLPGFIEPHAHLQLTVAGGLFPDLTPCIPDKYQVIYNRDFPKGKSCKNYINEAFSKLADKPLINGWYVGNGMDPSRMHLQLGGGMKSSQEYLSWPANYIENFDMNSGQFVFDKGTEANKPFAKKPFFILDQSGHLAYVNKASFDKAKICGTKVTKSLETYAHQASIEITDKLQTQWTALMAEGNEIKCQGTQAELKHSLTLAQVEYVFPDGEWGIHCKKDNDCQFSGLLKEESSYAPFIDAVKTSQNKLAALQRHHGSNQDMSGLQQGMLDMLNIASQQGVTTFVEGGGSDKAMIDSYKAMVKQDPAAVPTRLRALYTWNINGYKNGEEEDNSPAFLSKHLEKISLGDKTYKGMFSTGGIKLWADGSTQGCSADLQNNYKGICLDFGKGHQNFDSDQIAHHLSDYWNNGWYINVHANGDEAILNTVDAFKQLANGKENDTPLTLIHATVNITDDEASSSEKPTIAAIKEAREILPNLSTSHLIAHVAYWGKAMENELGYDRAKNIDPTRTEWDSGIPVSLHSDMSVSPLYPLWFVEQAVTRATWQYPNLSGDGTELNPGQALTPYQALMAITINPAKQHNIDNKLGSLEETKLADFVVLSDNPLDVPSKEIHKINVACSFVNGQQVQWKNKASDCELNASL